MSGVLADVLQPCPPCVPSVLPVDSLAELFAETLVDRVLVVDDGALIGAIAAGDVDRCICANKTVTAGDLAGRHVITADEHTDIEKAFATFQNGVDQFVVVLDDGFPVGCVRPADVFAWASENKPNNAMARPHMLDGAAVDSVMRPAG